MIGSVDCLCRLWLGTVITLILVSEHLINLKPLWGLLKRLSSICFCFTVAYSQQNHQILTSPDQRKVSFSFLFCCFFIFIFFWDERKHWTKKPKQLNNSCPDDMEIHGITSFKLVRLNLTLNCRKRLPKKTYLFQFNLN